MDLNVLAKGVDLEKFSKERAREYQQAKPFPHIAIDELFDPGVLREILQVFPGPDSIEWRRFHSHQEIKLAASREAQLPGRVQQFLYQLNSSTFLGFLERLTGISGLISDPHFIGGGMHQILPGGKLDIHSDFNKHAQWGLDRRLNLLLYLNEDWKEEYGGHLELWDKGMSVCEKKLNPLFNRMVIFSTTDTSYHGHPRPLTCPEGRSRKSLALYYYSNGRSDEGGPKVHSTLFRSLPTDTVFQRYVSPFIPPIAYKLFDKVRGR
jgi:hypothetical protein